MNNTIEIREELQSDWMAVEKVTREAFNSEDEVNLVKDLRNQDGVISFVAFIESHTKTGVVGHLMISPMLTANQNDQNFKISSIGPVSVDPEIQRQGVGKLLMKHAIEFAKNQGMDAIMLLGHPKYYVKFGFKPAFPRGITSNFGVMSEAWMFLELTENFRDFKGEVTYHPAFSGVE